MNYRKTLIACYMGFVTQAIAANFAPLLFLTFHNNYNISLGKIALISSVFFITQLIVDILCAHFADVIGYRKCVVGSQLLSAVGLIGLAFLPQVTTDPFTGIIISTILYAIGSGLTEVLVSPIVEACPFEHKEAAMSLLHSFYCWGAVGVILLSTLFFSLFGIENWRVLSCIWAVIPLCNVFNFAVCPIEHPHRGRQGFEHRQPAQSSAVLALHFAYDMCRSVGAFNGAMGVCLCGISIGTFKINGRYCRPLYVCRYNGYKPIAVRKIW